MLDTIIKNILLLVDDDWQPMEIGLSGGRIAEVGAGISAAAREEINGGGAYCLPGAVDLHVHFNEPGRTHWEGFSTGSAAAAAGGVTTLAEMPLNSIPSTVSVAALEQKLATIGSKSYVDYALWGGVVPGNADEILPLAKAGVMGFKAFMSPSGTDDFTNADTATLREAMQRIAPTGLRLALHAEDPAVLAQAEAAQGSRLTAFDWEASRPVEAEISAVAIAIELAEKTGCPMTIVHVSSPEVLKLIDAAKARGVDVVAETCPHYLLLTINDADQIGTRAKCAPPLRELPVVEVLRESVRRGQIDTIGSDHSPSSPELKVGKHFYEAWGGISGLQHGLPLTADLGGFMDVEWMQAIHRTFCERPAALAGLPGKGAIAVGRDADFVLMEALQEPVAIAEQALLYRHPFTAYAGMPQKSVVQSTWLRGRCICQNGKMVAPPSGRFMKAGGL